jgi:hypothetical protein
MKYDKLVLLLACLLVVAFSLFQFVSLFITVNTTGILNVSSNDKNSTLSISQIDHQAKIIGTGKAKIRLKAGNYQISATDNGYQAIVSVQMQKNKTTSRNLSLPIAAKSQSSGGLFNKMPFLGPSAEYEIVNVVGAQNNVSGPLIVIASSNEQTKQAALQWIHQQGYNPNDYIIDYQTVQLHNYHYTNNFP